MRDKGEGGRERGRGRWEVKERKMEVGSEIGERGLKEKERYGGSERSREEGRGE